jgi:hypothetical protein
MHRCGRHCDARCCVSRFAPRGTVTPILAFARDLSLQACPVVCRKLAVILAPNLLKCANANRLLATAGITAERAAVEHECGPEVSVWRRGHSVT